MKLLPFYPDWTKATKDSAIQLTAPTGSPGHLWPYPHTALPENISKGFPNQINGCYISGYIDSENSSGSVTPIGELLVTRDHDVPESGKAYVYLVAKDKDDIPYFRGPYKPFPQHYYSKDCGVPVHQLFGRVDLKNLNMMNV